MENHKKDDKEKKIIDKLSSGLKGIKLEEKGKTKFESKVEKKILTKKGICGYCYDPKMLLHKSDSDHVERPERISSIYDNLMNVIKKEKLENKFVEIKSKQIDSKFLNDYVNKKYIEKLENLENIEGDTYISDHTYSSALLSAGCTISCIDAIFKEKICDNAFAIVRPPGHHCEHLKYQGFCFLNNVYLAYLHAKYNLGLKKIVIVDWDVHYGDGTYELIKKDSDVLFFSLHRYEEKRFYPGTGNPTNIGEDEAKFTKANIGWNTTLSKWATSLSRVSDH